MIYCIGAYSDDRGRDLEAIKLGFTARSAESRLETMRTGCPLHLKILWAISEGTLAHERELHRACVAHRLRREWFRPDALTLLDACRVVFPDIPVEMLEGQEYAMDESGDLWFIDDEPEFEGGEVAWPLLRINEASGLPLYSEGWHFRSSLRGLRWVPRADLHRVVRLPPPDGPQLDLWGGP